MSRMLAWMMPRPLPAAALGVHDPDGLVDRFAALSTLHSDGWGSALVSEDRTMHLAFGLHDAAVGMRAAAARPARAGLLYLRFASAGTTVRSENLQPFGWADLAFAHNGAVSPRAPLLDLLDDADRTELAGDTDSEAYGAFVRRLLSSTSSASPEQIVAGAVGRLRSLYPEACLNALILREDALLAVHAPGSSPPPLAAFASRGVTGPALPPGHDETYNVMFTAVTRSGVRIVSCSGVTGTDWSPLPRDTVTRYSLDGTTATTPIPPARHHTT